MMKQYFLYVILIFSVSYPTISKSQVIRKSLCEEFLNAKKLYLIENSINTTKLTTSNGKEFTLKELIQENWPDKKIIELDRKKYNKVDQVRKQFHISTSTFKVIGDRFTSSIDGIIIQRGKTGRDPKRTLYWINLNMHDIISGNLSERLIYTVKSLQEILVNYNDDSYRSRYFYKKEGYKEYMKKDTLYIPQEYIYRPEQNLEATKKLYPYNLKIVSYDVWAEAIKDKKENVLFMEVIRAGYYSGVDIYSAEEGRIIFSSYPWKAMGNNFYLSNSYFDKMFK